ncbi:hypothetical protein PS645_02504 [Pseudomonas fluorescens]|uniref:ABC transporter substrate-binding protein PnrA-like domain-containing protein n=1 Tax=Pseudomonas fluorescens TaxID=294 RepID=A0A5E6TCG2_PSEFL|nr:hypothetical protein PS645_02504 [Pseudomonas fluorescens]
MHERPLKQWLCAVAAAIGLSASLNASVTDPLKIGFVYIGPIVDQQDKNPGTEMKLAWVNSWFDPDKETDAANVLMDQGVNVAFQHSDSPAPIQAAEKRGVFAVGNASDMAYFGPKAVLTLIVND